MQVGIVRVRPCCPRALLEGTGTTTRKPQTSRGRGGGGLGEEGGKGIRTLEVGRGQGKGGRWERNDVYGVDNLLRITFILTHAND